MANQPVFWLAIGTGPESPVSLYSSWQLGLGPNGKPECVPAGNWDRVGMASLPVFQLAIGIGPEWLARMYSGWQLGPAPNGKPECVLASNCDQARMVASQPVPAGNRDQAQMASHNVFRLAIGTTGPEWQARMCSSWQSGPGPNDQPGCILAGNWDQARMHSGRKLGPSLKAIGFRLSIWNGSHCGGSSAHPSMTDYFLASA